MYGAVIPSCSLGYGRDRRHPHVPPSRGADRGCVQLGRVAQRFTEHVEHLARGGGVVPLAEIAQPADALKIAITFDDGYADNATRAAPELAAASLPVTYFVTTGRLGGQHFWWDRLSTGLLGAQPRPQGIDVTVGDRGLWLALNDLQAARTSLRFLHRRLRPLPPDELAATVDDLLHRLGATEPPADDCTMTVEQLRVMGQLPMVEIGAHTRTHVQLGGQSKELQRSEVIGSITDLSGVLGRPITSFAYPFGSPEAVGDVAPRLAREAGCVLACSTVHGRFVGPPTLINCRASMSETGARRSWRRQSIRLHGRANNSKGCRPSSVRRIDDH